MSDAPELNGVSLREYIELLVDAKTNEIKLVMAERVGAVQTAYQQHDVIHAAMGKDIEHIAEVQSGFEKWLKTVGSQLSTIRGQMIGAGAVLVFVIAAIQIGIAVYNR